MPVVENLFTIAESLKLAKMSARNFWKLIATDRAPEVVHIGRCVRVARFILLIRGQRVILDADLAALFGVPTKRLNEQVRRNRDRFPADFLFQLSKGEFDNLRCQSGISSLKSQFATSSAGWGGRRYRPYAFTEYGAIMAANVLNSSRAVRASIYVVRAFVKLRELLSTHKELAHKLNELERRLDTHDHKIMVLLDAIRELMEPPPEPKRAPIGFHSEARPSSRRALQKTRRA